MEKPMIDSDDDVEWWLANNYGPHVNIQAWEWIKQLRAEIARLTPVAPDRAGGSTGDDESSTRAAGEHDG